MPCRGSCGSRPNARSESSASWLSRQMWGGATPCLCGRAGAGLGRVVGRSSGWAMRNRHFWRQDDGYRSWIEFFFDQQLPELHSTKQYEDTVGWALETNAEAMIA